MKVKFEIDLPKRDYEILNKWDYYFEKNISDYLIESARTLRKCIEESNNKTEK